MGIWKRVKTKFSRKESNIEVEQIRNIHTMSVDKILQSDAFGLVSPFSEETQKHIDRFYKLKKKKKLTSDEERDIQASIPFVEQTLGYNGSESETEKSLNEFIKHNWK